MCPLMRTEPVVQPGVPELVLVQHVVQEVPLHRHTSTQRGG